LLVADVRLFAQPLNALSSMPKLSAIVTKLGCDLCTGLTDFLDDGVNHGAEVLSGSTVPIQAFVKTLFVFARL
jgi:hypothetical protein